MIDHKKGPSHRYTYRLKVIFSIIAAFYLPVNHTEAITTPQRYRKSHKVTNACARETRSHLQTLRSQLAVIPLLYISTETIHTKKPPIEPNFLHRPIACMKT